MTSYLPQVDPLCSTPFTEKLQGCLRLPVSPPHLPSNFKFSLKCSILSPSTPQTLLVSHLGPLWGNSSGEFAASVLLRLLTVQRAQLPPPPNLALGSYSLGFPPGLLPTCPHRALGRGLSFPLTPPPHTLGGGPETGFLSHRCTGNPSVSLQSSKLTSTAPECALCLDV